jgi:hypothetical protein
MDPQMPDIFLAVFKELDGYVSEPEKIGFAKRINAAYKATKMEEYRIMVQLLWTAWPCARNSLYL